MSIKKELDKKLFLCYFIYNYIYIYYFFSFFYSFFMLLSFFFSFFSLALNEGCEPSGEPPNMPRKGLYRPVGRFLDYSSTHPSLKLF